MPSAFATSTHTRYRGYCLCICTCLSLLLAHSAAAVTHAYRSTGEHGEVLFSDIPSSTAEVVPLQESTHTTPSASSAQQVALMLAVADELAAARRTREQAREERRRRAAEAQRAAHQQRHRELQELYEPRYFYPFFPGHNHGGYLPAPPPAEAHERPTKSFKFELK